MKFLSGARARGASNAIITGNLYFLFLYNAYPETCHCYQSSARGIKIDILHIDELRSQMMRRARKNDYDYPNINSTLS